MAVQGNPIAEVPAALSVNKLIGLKQIAPGIFQLVQIDLSLISGAGSSADVNAIRDRVDDAEANIAAILTDTSSIPGALAAKADKAREITGDGILAGLGGDFSADRTWDLPAASNEEIDALTPLKPLDPPGAEHAMTNRFASLRAGLVDGVVLLRDGAAVLLPIGVKSLQINTSIVIDNSAADDVVYEIVDSETRVVERLDVTGKHVVAEHAPTERTSTPKLALMSGEVTSVETTADPDFLESVGDDAGNIARSLAADGTERVPAIETLSLTAKAATVRSLHAGTIFRSANDKRGFDHLADVCHILWRGQSWPGGADAGPIRNTNQIFDSLCFNGGVRQQYTVADDASRLQSFVPAYEILETATREISGTWGETGAVSACNTVKELIALENNIAFGEQSFQLLVSWSDEGSKSLDQLADNAQVWMQRVKATIDRGYAIAQSLGKTYCVGAITWIQDQATSNTTYGAQLEEMRLDIDTYAKSVTGQANDVKLITWQRYPNSDTQSNIGSVTKVNERHLAPADTYPHIYCCGPSYQIDQIAVGNIHFGSAAMAELGRQFGLAIKRILVDKAAYEPLRIIAVRRQGVIAMVRFNVPLGDRLLWDTTKFAAVPNYGINLIDGSGAVAAQSTLPVITGPDTIRLVATSTIGSDWQVGIADIADPVLTKNRWRCNLRTAGEEYLTVNQWPVAQRHGFDN